MMIKAKRNADSCWLQRKERKERKALVFLFNDVLSSRNRKKSSKSRRIHHEFVDSIKQNEFKSSKLNEKRSNSRNSFHSTEFPRIQRKSQNKCRKTERNGLFGQDEWPLRALVDRDSRRFALNPQKSINQSKAERRTNRSQLLPPEMQTALEFDGRLIREIVGGLSAPRAFRFVVLEVGRSVRFRAALVFIRSPFDRLDVKRTEKNEEIRRQSGGNPATYRTAVAKSALVIDRRLLAGPLIIGTSKRIESTHKLAERSGHDGEFVTASK